MRRRRPYGSVRGAISDDRPYRVTYLLGNSVTYGFDAVSFRVVKSTI
jgi:hypothetical protein